MELSGDGVKTAKGDGGGGDSVEEWENWEQKLMEVLEIIRGTANGGKARHGQLREETD